MSRSRIVLLVPLVLAAIELVAAGYQSSSNGTHAAYIPARDNWEHRKPADVGMDAAKLEAAVEFMKGHETAAPARDFSDQEIIFGKLLGSIPAERGATNGVIVRHGYIVAEFGDTLRPDPTYSVAKSMLSTVASVALDKSGNVVGKGDFAAQATQVFENLKLALAAAGAGFDNLFKVTTFVTDMSEIQTLRGIRSKYYGKNAPASTLVQIGKLANEQLMIEIEAIAVVPQ